MTTTTNVPLTQRPAWKALQAHCRDIRGRHLRQLFAESSSEAAVLVLDEQAIADDLLLDTQRLLAESKASWNDLSRTKIPGPRSALLCFEAKSNSLTPMSCS